VEVVRPVIFSVDEEDGCLREDVAIMTMARSWILTWLLLPLLRLKPLLAR